MAIRTLVVIMLSVSLLVVVYGIFQGAFPDVTERMLEFIDIPDKDPTPPEIGTAERLSEVFSSYNGVKNALARAAQNDKACYATHEPFKHLRHGKKESLTLELMSEGSGSQLRLVRGTAPSENENKWSTKVLKEATLDVKPCILEDQGPIKEALRRGDSPLSSSVASQVSPSSVDGFFWNNPEELKSTTRTQRSTGYGRAGAPNTRTSWNYELPEGMDKHYVLHYDGHACFLRTGWNIWGLFSRISEAQAKSLNEVLDKKCSEPSGGN